VDASNEKQQRFSQVSPSTDGSLRIFKSSDSSPYGSPHKIQDLALEGRGKLLRQLLWLFSEKHVGLAIRGEIQDMLLDLIFPKAVKDDVVASVREGRDVDNLPDAPYRINTRISMVVLFPISPQQGHPDQLMIYHSILDHLSVTRLEDVKR